MRNKYKILAGLISVLMSGCAYSIPTYTETVQDIDTGGNKDMEYDFSIFPNVSITGVKLSSLSNEELEILYLQAMYCQAMTDADIDTMRKLVSEDMTYTHMSGMKQTREEYFADISSGKLNYFTIGIDKPVIQVNGDKAHITYTSILNANAYGAQGTYHMKGTHNYEKRNGNWIAVNR
ncbi:MAG: nuclear transport factor 2 family protein [Faecalicoccus sp.]|nr:nuclear transport factor 2 family protein [Faecalicoccus sp.]